MGTRTPFQHEGEAPQAGEEEGIMMADEDTTTTDPPAAATVPKERLEKEIEKRRALEQENADFRKRLDALEDSGKSDIERLTKELERERAARADQEKTAGELQGQIERANKSSLVRDAAAKLNLVDPDAAVAFANLDDIGDAGDAKRFAERLAKDKPYLVSQQQDGPNLRQVFGPGGSTPQNGQEQRSELDLSEPELKRMQGEAILTEINKARVQAGLEPITPAGAGVE